MSNNQKINSPYPGVLDAGGKVETVAAKVYPPEESTCD